ncbi:hypothetical protein TIFTF001_046388, partial [Ficus carica]
ISSLIDLLISDDETVTVNDRIDEHDNDILFEDSPWDEGEQQSPDKIRTIRRASVANPLGICRESQL